MNNLEQFWASVEKEETGILATCADGRVTMRNVSPVAYEGAILIFTNAESLKYQQLKANPKCSMAVGGCFVEAEATLLGPTMAQENAKLREVYDKKFTGAFADIPFGGRDADFILLKPTLVKGWTIENGEPTGPFEYAL